MSIALIAIVVLFCVGYLVIALEHPLHVDKAATALFIGVGCWTIYALNLNGLMSLDTIPGWFQEEIAEEHAEHAAHEDADHGGGTHGAEAGEKIEDAGHIAGGLTAESSHPVPVDDPDFVLELKRKYLLEGQLHVLLAEISEILFFLLGAMTIVELVDAHEGFAVITSRINANSKVKLLWMTSWLSFFMSAVLDNLTSTIVMVSLIRKLVADEKSRLLFVGMVVVAANAGGAWTVIGDVTTTMLWIGGKLSVIGVIKAVILPSIVCLLLPLLLLSLTQKGQAFTPRDSVSSALGSGDTPFTQRLFLGLGLCGLLSVPVFKLVTHLPPFVGMLGSLAVLWIVSDVIRRNLDEDRRTSTNVVHVLRKVDSASILFFMGILLAVGSLQATGLLATLAEKLDAAIGNRTIVAIGTGLFSAIVDNVPLVAAGIEMYTEPMDAPFWLLLAYTAGTGGSCLIIGSAAGVAAMGLEKITFGYYLKKIAPLALLGYAAGVAVFLAQWKFAPAVFGLE